MADRSTTPARSASLPIRALHATLKWMGHGAAILFWLGAAMWQLLDLLFAPGVATQPPTLSPDGHHGLYSSALDPGAFGRVRRSFALWREGSERRFVAYVDLVAEEDAGAIQTHWIDGTSIELRNVPLSSMRSIRQAGPGQGARMIVRFKEE